MRNADNKGKGVVNLGDCNKKGVEELVREPKQVDQVLEANSRTGRLVRLCLF